MAGLQQRNNSYRVIFRHHGKQHAFTLGPVSRQEAEAKAAHVDYLLLRLKQRLIALPPGIDIVTFVQFDGKPPTGAAGTPVAPTSLPLRALRDRYLEGHRGALEANTLYIARIHFNHLVATLGEAFPLPELRLGDLQRHIDRRCRDGVVPTTVEKEIRTLRTAWNWAARMDLLHGPYPNKGLVYPRTAEKPPFQTWAEIERQIAGLAEAERDELWAVLYLTLPETEELLGYIREHAGPGWVHPMACTAAHTGAQAERAGPHAGRATSTSTPEW